jgi:hypothetical protein
MSGDPEVKWAPFRWLALIESALDLTRPNRANEEMNSAWLASPHDRPTTFLTQRGRGT